MLNRIRASFAGTLAIAITELRTDVRLIRTWFFAIFIAGFSVISFALEQFILYRELSSISSGSLVYTALTLPLTIFVEFQFLLAFGVIFLTFDFLSRDKRARIDEVVHTLPISNIQLVFGRALGISVLYYVITIVFVSSYYFVGMVFEYSWPDTAFRRSETFSTIATLVYDGFPFLLFWTAIVMFVTIIARYRVFTALISIGTMILFYWLKNNGSADISVFLGVDLLTTQLPSDIAPLFGSMTVALQRCMLVLFSCVLLFLVAKLHPRLERSRNIHQLLFFTLLIVLVIFSGVSLFDRYQGPLSERAEFARIHREIENSCLADVVAMEGTVDLAPGDTIAIDLTLELLRVGECDKLVFSLNPGYTLQNVILNQESVEYSFDRGVLTIETNGDQSLEEVMNVRVMAKGDPNINFAYLGGDLIQSTVVPMNKTRLIGFGTHASINHANYVALLPSIGWYPKFGSHFSTYVDDKQPLDYFDIDLIVSVPESWFVGGPGKSGIEDDTQGRRIRLKPQRPIHQVAIFASEFERRTLNIEGIEFELLVSSGNIENIREFISIVEDVKVEIASLINRAREIGLEYPFSTFSIIEVPLFLNPFELVLHMPSTQSQPGIALLREGTFLAADFRTPMQLISDNSDLTDTEKRVLRLRYLTGYFNNDISGGNVIAAALNNVFLYRLDPISDNPRSFRYLFSYLIQELFDVRGGFYSGYILRDPAAMDVANIGMKRIASGSSSDPLSEHFFGAYVDRPEVWNSLLEPRPIRALKTSQLANEHHAQILRAKIVGDLLLDLYGDERVGQLLAKILNRFDGTSFTIHDVKELALEADMPLDDIAWMLSRDALIPGFRVSEASSVRIPDDSDNELVFETSFFVSNSESNSGFIRVEHSSYEQESLLSTGFHTTHPIKIPGNSSIEVSIHSPEPLEVLQVYPYLSRNRSVFKVRVPDRIHIPSVNKLANPHIRSADWKYDEDNIIIIDDLDVGFVADESDDEESLYRFLLYAIVPYEPYSHGLDAGLKSMGGFAGFSEQEWVRQEVETAFGRYRKTIVRSDMRSSELMVHFHATIPTLGNWMLEYHLPDVSLPTNRQVPYWGNFGIMLSERSEWADFELLITNEHTTVPIFVDGNDMVAGWNKIGTYDLTHRNVKVSVRSDASLGTIVADAIRWTQVDH